MCLRGTRLCNFVRGITNYKNIVNSPTTFAICLARARLSCSARRWVYKLHYFFFSIFFVVCLFFILVRPVRPPTPRDKPNLTVSKNLVVVARLLYNIRGYRPNETKMAGTGLVPDPTFRILVPV